MPQATASMAGFSRDLHIWSKCLQSICGNFGVQRKVAQEFIGLIERRRICGLDIADVAHNADVIQRAAADVRRDQQEHYFLILQCRGQASMEQNGHAAELQPGDLVLIDSTRPSTFSYGGHLNQELSLHLPRQTVIAHLGYEPKGGQRIAGSDVLGRVLSSTITNIHNSVQNDCDTPFLRLALLDLLGAALSPAMQLANQPVTAHSEQLYQRAMGVMRDRFMDPDTTPASIAASVGISQRYLQKLFFARGSSCGQELLALRLDNAAALLRRQSDLAARSRVTDIACSSGFHDSSHFSKAFRGRFGCSPRQFANRAGSGLNHWADRP